LRTSGFQKKSILENGPREQKLLAAAKIAVFTVISCLWPTGKRVYQPYTWTPS
jgi:hypothetical protein